MLLLAAGWVCEDARTDWKREDDFLADREELLKFGNDMHVQNWTDGSRNWMSESLSVCAWEGVCCASVEGTPAALHPRSKLPV